VFGNGILFIPSFTENDKLVSMTLKSMCEYGKTRQSMTDTQSRYKVQMKYECA